MRRAIHLLQEAALPETSICVIPYERDHRPDAMLRQVVCRLEAGGLQVRGLLQDGQPGTASTCATLFLEDIGTGRRIQAFEQRGAAARGCRLDPAGLAESAGWLREAIAAQPNVLFVNRFGHQEAEGRGLRDEIAAAVVAGLPFVIAVHHPLLPKWHAFAGEGCSFATADPERIEAWCLGALPREARQQQGGLA
jgi:hypothetical protein